MKDYINNKWKFRTPMERVTVDSRYTVQVVGFNKIAISDAYGYFLPFPIRYYMEYVDKASVIPGASDADIDRAFMREYSHMYICLN